MVEIIPKKPTRQFSWVNMLFYFSLILLFFVILSIFILNNFQKRASLILQDLDKKYTEIRTPERINLESELIKSQKKIDDFAFLLLKYKLSSKLFNFLERITHPKVYFSSFSFNAEENKLKMGGKTESFETLGQQFLIFKRENLIKEINLSGITIGEEGKIEFSFDLYLSPEIFK